MTLEELESLKEVKDFNTYGISISKFNDFPDYYNDYLESRDTCSYYTQYKEFMWATGDARFRYIEVDVDGDDVCFFFKCVFFMNVKSLKLYDLPVSRNNNIDNVYKVMKVLCDKDFFVSFVMDEGRLLEGFPKVNLDKIERHYMSDNFYSTLDSVNERMSNAFRSKYRINNLEKHLTYKFYESLDDDMIELAESIYKEWSTKVPSPGEFKQFKGILRFNSDNLRYLFTYYDDDPVSVSVFLNAGKYCIEEFCYTKVRSDFEDKLKKKSLNKLVLYIKLLELQYMRENFGTDTLYVLGSGEASQKGGLYQNKLENNKGFVKYYMMKKEDVLCYLEQDR